MSVRTGGNARTRISEGPDLAAGVGGVTIAVGLCALGGLLVALAPLLGTVTSAAGQPAGAQPGAAVIAAVLVVAVPALSVLLLRGGRVLGAVGVLSGWAAGGVGAVVLDLQLLAGPIDANRFELFRPTSAAALSPDAGAIAVLTGHLLIVLSGAVALWAMRRSALLDDPEGFDIGLLGGGDTESRGTSLAGRCGRPMTAATTAVAVAVVVALFAPALHSTDPVVLVSAVVDSARPLLIGTALLAVAVLVVVALALVSTSVPTGAGAVAGVALGALAVFAPRLVAASALNRISIGWGSILGAVAALALAACALALARSRRRLPKPAAADRAVTEIALPDRTQLHRVSATLGLLGGVASVVAAMLPTLSTPAGVTQPQLYTVRTLALAGVLLAVLCAGMLTEVTAPMFRPVVGIAWTAPVLGASGVLQAVLVATAAPGVGAGPGAWVAVLAVLLALGCGVGAGLAGAVERDDIDTSRADSANRAVAAAGAVAAVAATLGLGLPLYAGSGAQSATVVAGAWGWDGWGLALVAVAVLSALLVSIRARRERGVALLVGVELVLVVHLASWPLTAPRLESSSGGAGAAFTVAALLAVATMAVLLGRGRRS